MATWPSISALFDNMNLKGTDANPLMRSWFEGTMELPGALPPQSLSILNGAITPARAVVVVDTEGGAPVDELTIISPVVSATDTLHDGMLLYIRAQDASRVVTIKHSAAINGIRTMGGQDISLGTDWWLMLRLDGNAWQEMPLGRPIRVATLAETGVMRPDGLSCTVDDNGVLRGVPATSTTLGVGRSATAAEIANGTTGADGPAWITPEQAAGVIPTGFVLPFAANSAPDGYILCNGAAVSRTTYATLFAVIGTLYGTGDGSTTFNIPNLTDRFIQGSATSGAYRAAGLPNIHGSVAGIHTNVSPVNNSEALYWIYTTGYNAPQLMNNPLGGAGLAFDAHRYNNIYGNSNTVQPHAINMRYYIKY